MPLHDFLVLLVLFLALIGLTWWALRAFYLNMTTTKEHARQARFLKMQEEREQATKEEARRVNAVRVKRMQAERDYFKDPHHWVDFNKDY
jgi:hypothetical protein